MYSPKDQHTLVMMVLRALKQTAPVNSRKLAEEASKGGMKV